MLQRHGICVLHAKSEFLVLLVEVARAELELHKPDRIRDSRMAEQVQKSKHSLMSSCVRLRMLLCVGLDCWTEIDV